MDIENRTIWDKRLEINDYTEPTIIDRCCVCNNEITNFDEYIENNDFDTFCSEECLIGWLIMNDFIFYKNK